MGVGQRLSPLVPPRTGARCLPGSLLAPFPVAFEALHLFGRRRGASAARELLVSRVHCSAVPATRLVAPCPHELAFPACSSASIMGIQGLLQFIKEAAEPSHVKKYKGQTVAVDTYCWLHKGAYACAEKLVRGEPTDV